MKNNADTSETPSLQHQCLSLLRSRPGHLMLLAVVALVAYANTFHVPMLFDDEGSIQLNTGIHGLANFFNGGYRFLPNRVVGYLTFALNYQFGGVNVAGYHVVNLAIHIINGFLVYQLVRLTFQTPLLRMSDFAPQADTVALAVALLFVSHPIQTQAVTYIVQRLTALATTFYLATLIYYFRWRLQAESGVPFSCRKVLTPYCLSLTVAILAMKTKEISFTLPFMVLLFEAGFFGLPDRVRLARLVPMILTWSIIPFTILSVVKKDASEVLSDVSGAMQVITGLTRWEYLCTQFSVIVTYLRLLVLPVNQNLDYDYPVNYSLFTPRAFLSLLLLLIIVAAALLLWQTGSPARRGIAPEENSAPPAGSFCPELRLIAIGIFWFFITLTVESSIIPISDVIFEHRVYLPSVGFFLAMAMLLMVTAKRLAPRFPVIGKLAAPVLMGIVLVLTVATHARNHVWRNWLTIWQDTVTKSPNKPRPHNILGIGYYYGSLFEPALQEYRAAIRLQRNYIEPYYNIGLILAGTKRHAEAIDIYQQAIGICGPNSPYSAKLYNELGVNYASLQDLGNAQAAFATAVKLQPDAVEFRNNLAYAQLMRGDAAAALREYRIVLGMDPGNVQASQKLREIERQQPRAAGP
jgi:tetratricopeptide (TPR) repeat protein